MNTEIQRKHFNKMKDSDKCLLKKTYEESFPLNERRNFSLINNLIKQENRFHMNGLYKGEEYVGFISEWDLESFLYIEHFAIEPAQRNQQIGFTVLKRYTEIQNKPIILEVEMPNNELSKRRISFYKRLGFTIDNHVYFQPPYHETDSWLEMRLMSFGEINLKESFNNIRNCLYQNVYSISPEKI